MSSSFEEVKAYYDSHAVHQVRDFVEGNDRVERAWLTIDQWAPANPSRVLEIGCGIGMICWRMSRRWPPAEVIGVDISPHSIEMARSLFPLPRLHFIEGRPIKGALDGAFDLIVLMDVYEHIAATQRDELHEALSEFRDEDGRIVLSFPTPRHLEWLRRYHPDQIQPIDEDITPDTISGLARDTGTEVLLYQEVGIWHEGDYAHAVLGRRNSWLRVAKVSPRKGVRAWMSGLRVRRPEPLVPTRAERLAMIRQRLVGMDGQT